MIEPDIPHILERFSAAVEAFRQWDRSLPPGPRYGEWERDYDHWYELLPAAGRVLHLSPENWRPETTEQILYVLARDNETELIADWVGDRPSVLIHLAGAARLQSDRDAKWQIAVRLGRMPMTNMTEDLLLAFARDADEYVRRIAMMALADLGSSHVEDLVGAAWKTGDEYQRMAGLYALQRIRSPRLAKFTELARADGRQFLIKSIERIP
jgi:hypothetical protein